MSGRCTISASSDDAKDPFRSRFKESTHACIVPSLCSDCCPRHCCWRPACAGCLPNATWLPDSSGFVYTGGKNKDALYLYDLEKKEPRVLVEKGAGPAWPAVSADGKRIAVALRHDDGKDVTLEVIVFDRDGKELHRSPKLDWTKHVKAASTRWRHQAFWVPKQDKVLLYSDGKTGRYDLKTKGVVTHDWIVSTFGDSPILSDGKGYLAYDREGGGSLVVVDWDDKEKKIELTPKDALKTFGQVGDPLQAMLYYPLMHASHWDGSTAVASWDDVRVKIDPDKAVGTVEHFKPALSEDKKVIQEQLQLPAGGVVRARGVDQALSSKNHRSGNEPPFGSYRIEAVKQGARGPKVLMDNAGFYMIYPSPDGKKAVVKCSKSLDAILTESKPDQDMLFLIDGTSEVTAEIDLAK